MKKCLDKVNNVTEKEIDYYKEVYNRVYIGGAEKKVSNLKINEWSVSRRIESLRQMDKKLSEMNVGSRYTIWQEYGGGLKSSEEETKENWKRIAEDNDSYNNALFCYMICTLENYALSGFENVK